VENLCYLQVMIHLIFKIISKSAWEQAMANAVFHGAAIDLHDGYIHFSTAAQVEETAQRHFAGQTDLLLVAFDASEFGDSLKWEASRGGALFPHLYGTLDPKTALWAKPLLWTGTTHLFPEGWSA
jgi:uncharacterized protein (DUF952 family)